MNHETCYGRSTLGTYETMKPGCVNTKVIEEEQVRKTSWPSTWDMLRD